jgi:hypothetical protein
LRGIVKMSRRLIPFTSLLEQFNFVEVNAEENDASGMKSSQPARNRQIEGAIVESR